MKLTHGEIAALCRDLAGLLHGGLSLNEGLFLLAEEEQGITKQMLTSMGQTMDLGYTLHRAMVQSAAFPTYVCGMVMVGEESGRLEETLKGLADDYEEWVHIRYRIRSALAYPCTILGLMLVVITVLLTEVLPVFASVYASLGVTMTGIPGLLLEAGRILGAAMPVLLGVLAVLVLAGFAVGCSPSLRENCKTRLLRRFGDGGVLGRFNNARFVRALALGLGSGLPLETALELACGLLAGIPKGAARCTACEKRVKAGEDLAEAMKQEGFLTPAQSRMLRLGLRSGSGDQVMAVLADSLTEEAEQALDSMVSRIEPAMVSICSVLVGAILLTAMLPLVDILSALGGGT